MQKSVGEQSANETTTTTYVGGHSYFLPIFSKSKLLFIYLCVIFLFANFFHLVSSFQTCFGALFLSLRVFIEEAF